MILENEICVGLSELHAGVINGKELPKESSVPKEMKSLRSSAFKKNKSGSRDTKFWIGFFPIVISFDKNC